MFTLIRAICTGVSSLRQQKGEGIEANYFPFNYHIKFIKSSRFNPFLNIVCFAKSGVIKRIKKTDIIK
jgi:hypothetical protein